MYCQTLPSVLVGLKPITMISNLSWIILILGLAAPSLRCDETCDFTDDKAESAFELPVISANEFIHGDKSTRDHIARKFRLHFVCLNIKG